MKKTTVIDFSDLLFLAEAEGYSWNKAHDMFVNNSCDKGEIDSEYFDEDYYEIDQIVLDLICLFMTDNNITEFYIKSKSY